MTGTYSPIWTDLVAITALEIAGIAYVHGDVDHAGLLIIGVVGWYFGHRTADIKNNRGDK